MHFIVIVDEKLPSFTLYLRNGIHNTNTGNVRLNCSVRA